MIPGISPVAPVWRAMRRHLLDRLERFQRELESLALSEAETAVLRGRIAELREIIDDVETAPADEEDSGPIY